ncbi:ATP synthase F1 subunit delta [Vibrio sonorensis]|uniref:ATP synthase F1 subunit delta n=1 Tax=Vibrio sonorensis TaxID=1004316 RepID=UPI001FE1845E|nr:ATP synthase F1 subunit delta [Vibrio sonorensis]
MLAFAKELSLVQELKTAALSLQPQQLAQLYVDVAGDKFDPAFTNFLKVLAENHRTSALSDIYLQFQSQTTLASNLKEVTVTSPNELTEAQVETLKASIEKRYDCQVQMECLVDEALVGGVVIRVGDTVLDNSVASRLTRLKDVIKP